MKNHKITIVLTMSLFIVSFFGCQKEIKPSDAPPSIKLYVATFFSDCKIQKVIKEKEKGKWRYDVTLNCGVNLEFEEDNRMRVVDIDSYSELPDAILPVKIVEYAETHYSDNYIIGWEYEANKTRQHVELNSHLILEFDSNNNFIKIVKDK